MAEFMFVNLNDPTQNKRREVRKLVRSHVSYKQHSQKRLELGQVQRPSKARYTDRSINGWAVLDDSRADHSSQLKVNATSGVDSGLFTQHQSILPSPVHIRCPRQLFNKELAASDNTRRRPRRKQCQPKASPKLLTPVPYDESNANTDSPQTVSTLSVVKSENTVTSPKGIIIKQEPDYQTDHKWEIVSRHSSRSQSLASPSTPRWDWKGEEPSITSFPLLYPSLSDPTDELRNRIELSRMSLSSVMVLPL
jgi:hypothetical protein